MPTYIYYECEWPTKQLYIKGNRSAIEAFYIFMTKQIKREELFSHCFTVRIIPFVFMRVSSRQRRIMKDGEKEGGRICIAM